MIFLHWVTDDKFIDDLISVMEYTKGFHSHTYAIVTYDDSYEFTYIKRYEDITLIRPNDFIAVLSSYDVIVLHGLRSGAFDFLNKMPHSIKVVWFAWGYDLYSAPCKKHPFIKIPLYRPLTKSGTRNNLRGYLADLHVGFNYLRDKRSIEKAISRVDYFSGVIPQEYEMMKKNPFFKAEPLDFHYFSLNDEVSEINLKNPSPTGDNILIGNSGDPTNNHLDAFQYLRTIDILDKKIYVPLSYGGTEKYREEVKSVGKKYWGDRFVPLDTFLPYEEYCKIISSCGNVVMFHERQQAMGNIRQGLWYGCKVFLSISGLPYRYYNNLGLQVFSVQHDLNANRIDAPLLPVEVEQNRSKMIGEVSCSHFINDIRKMYEILGK
jgi:4-alpha-L-fucosyltransferase (fuc4NAc transferase)